MLDWWFVGYFAVVNMITFVFWGIDKRRAIKKKRRIPEKKLLLFSALGGVVGAFCGMEIFRHKRIKGEFMWKWLLILVFWIGVILFFGVL